MKSMHGRSVLEGALVVLDKLARYDERPAGLSELAREAGLPKTTTHRILHQLIEVGAVERAGDGYTVGRKLARIGASATSRTFPMARPCH